MQCIKKKNQKKIKVVAERRMNDRIFSLALLQKSNLRNESTKLNNKNIGKSKDSEQHMD